MKYIIHYGIHKKGTHHFVIESNCNSMFVVPWLGDTISPPDVDETRPSRTKTSSRRIRSWTCSTRLNWRSRWKRRRRSSRRCLGKNEKGYRRRPIRKGGKRGYEDLGNWTLSYWLCFVGFGLSLRNSINGWNRGQNTSYSVFYFSFLSLTIWLEHSSTRRSSSTSKRIFF